MQRVPMYSERYAVVIRVSIDYSLSRSINFINGHHIIIELNGPYINTLNEPPSALEFLRIVRTARPVLIHVRITCHPVLADLLSRNLLRCSNSSS